MARALHDPTLEDFIQRRAAQDGDGACREVIVRLVEPTYVKLIEASRRYRQTPGALAGDYVRSGLADISGSMRALKGAPEDPDTDLVHELAAERAKVRELEAALTAQKAEPVASEESIRHLIQERDGWKATAEELRGQLHEAQDQIGRLADNFGAKLREPIERIAELEQELREESALRVGAIERMKAAEFERDALQDALNQQQNENDKLMTELASCARQRSPEVNEMLSQIETHAAAALREQASRGPEPYGLDRQAAEDAPSEPDALLTPAFIKSCVGYHWAGVSVSQIAATLRCDEAAVRRALKAKGRAA